MVEHACVDNTSTTTSTPFILLVHNEYKLTFPAMSCLKNPNPFAVSSHMDSLISSTRSLPSLGTRVVLLSR